jgi:SAM-dependent methyltransferase
MKFIPTDESMYVRQQYKTKDNLQVRIQTHEKYTQPKVDFLSFVLDQISWTGKETVIDVGCGAGAYVEPTRKRCSLYYACDLSFGMLQGLPLPGPSRVNLDAQQLPFADESADIVLANHMLYHVPNKDAAVSEIKRVLKPGGTLLAATNSANNMPELTDFRLAIGRKFGLESDSPRIRPVLSFTLEEGTGLLSRHFDSVTRHDQHSALVFPTSQPVVDYINSSRSYYEALIPETFDWAELEASLHKELSDHIAEHGHFRVNKLTGVFVCQKS